MRRYKSIVYDPPAPDFSFLAVVVDSDWSLTAARPFASATEARVFLTNTVGRMKAKVDSHGPNRSSDRPSFLSAAELLGTLNISATRTE
jgi:hypothetical protein